MHPGRTSDPQAKRSLISPWRSKGSGKLARYEMARRSSSGSTTSVSASTGRAFGPLAGAEGRDEARPRNLQGDAPRAKIEVLEHEPLAALDLVRRNLVLRHRVEEPRVEVESGDHRVGLAGAVRTLESAGHAAGSGSKEATTRRGAAGGFEAVIERHS